MLELGVEHDPTPHQHLLEAGSAIDGMGELLGANARHDACLVSTEEAEEDRCAAAMFSQAYGLRAPNAPK